ncbi:MAG: hypothetical protein J0L75_02060 [Spirochaetes bacterium]|nr:hypothetical protein [Spirochaetota bacterium]
MKTIPKSILFLVFAVCLICTQGLGAWIIKVGDQEYATREFQDYINLLRAQGGSEQVKLALRDVEDLNIFLQQFIDRKAVLYAASKAGYTKKNEGLNKAWEQQKEQLFLQFFLTWQIQQVIGTPQVKEEDLKGFYTRDISKGQGKPWEALADQEKLQVQQAYMQMRMKKDYQDRLEKKYKVTRSPKNDDFYVAQVEGTKIKLSEIDDTVGQELAARGVSKDVVAKQNPAMLDQFRKEIRETRILLNLVKTEMANLKFTSSPTGVLAEAFLWESFLLDRYLDGEFKSKIQVSDKERDEEFNRNKEQLKNQPYDQVKNTLETFIRERKFQQRYPVFVSEKKEEIQVRRNRDELSKIQ